MIGHNHRLWILQQGLCAYCGVEMCIKGDASYEDWRAATVDHVVPRIKGGRSDKSNLLLACKSCNNLKGDLDASDFRARLDAGEYV